MLVFKLYLKVLTFLKSLPIQSDQSTICTARQSCYCVYREMHDLDILSVQLLIMRKGNEKTVSSY